jgi:hypothetical protein
MARRSICLVLVIWACSPVTSPGFEDLPKASEAAGGQVPAADRPQGPAALPKRLKDRDSEFDNRSVESEQRWVEKVRPRALIPANRFDARRFGRPDLHILGATANDGLLRWEAYMLQWSSGYGIARWIESIDTVEAGDGMLTAKGRMRLLGHDDSRFELQLDHDLILRHAVISVPARHGDGSNEYIVETRGTVRPEGCPPVAESGRFRRILKPAGKPESVYQDYEVRFVAASARLTDEQYDERTRIEPGPGAITVDAWRGE